MEEVGRPTELDDELFLKIRDLILAGKEMTEIAEILNISYKTMEGWVTRNYKGFSDKMLSFRQEKKLQKAEENIDDFLDMETENTGVTKKGDKFSFNDPRLVKVKADVSLFVAETLGKKHYSKKQETELSGGIKNYVITRGEGFALSASSETTGNSEGSA